MTRSVLKNSYLRSSRRAILRSRRIAAPSVQASAESDMGSGRRLNFSSVQPNSGNDRTSGSMARRSFPRRAIHTTPSDESPGRSERTARKLFTPRQSSQTCVLEICSFFIFHFPFDIWHLPLPEPIFFNGKCQISNGKWKMKSTTKLLHHFLPDLLLLEVP